MIQMKLVNTVVEAGYNKSKEGEYLLLHVTKLLLDLYEPWYTTEIIFAVILALHQF